jgi:hypothetical protein
MPVIEPIPTDKFDLIVNLALYSRTDYKKANARLKRVLKTVYVDTRDKTLLHTPASYLAYKKDFWAVDFLMHHGASVHHVAYGAAMGGDQKFVNKLSRFHGANEGSIIKGAIIGGTLTLCPVDDSPVISKTLSGFRPTVDILRQEYSPSAIQTIAVTAAFIGDSTYVDTLLENFSSMSIPRISFNVAMLAIFGGHLDHARRICESSGMNLQMLIDDVEKRRGASFDNYNPNLHNIPWNATEEYFSLELDNRIKPQKIIFGRSATLEKTEQQSQQILHHLVYLPSGKIRTRFINDLDSLVELSKFIAKADKIRSLRKIFNYHQCISLGYSDLMTWFRHGEQIKKRKGLDDKIFTLIGTFLAPLTENESADLNSKLIIARARTTFIVDLRRHCNTPYPYFQYTEADKFLRSIELTNPYSSPMPLLHHEIKKRCKGYLYSPTDNVNPYFYVLAKHYNKLIQLPQKDIIAISPKPDFFTKVLISDKFHHTTKKVYKDVKTLSKYGFLDDFKHSYLEDREFSFFKSRTSVILKKIENKTLTLADIKHHMVRNRNSRTRRIYKILKAQRMDRLVIRDFVTSYRKYSSFFGNPFGYMRRRLTRLRSMQEIISHAKKNPDSTTQRALSNPFRGRYKV